MLLHPGAFADSKSNVAAVDQALRSQLAPGDLVMLFTDGLFEVEGTDSQEYSQDLLLESVRKNASLHCPDLFTSILGEIQNFSVTHEFSDDVCLVGLEVSEKF